MIIINYLLKKTKKILFMDSFGVRVKQKYNKIAPVFSLVLVVFLAFSVLFVPKPAQALRSTGQLVKPDSVAFKTTSDKGFARTTKGEKVTLNVQVSLATPDELHMYYATNKSRDWLKDSSIVPPSLALYYWYSSAYLVMKSREQGDCVTNTVLKALGSRDICSDTFSTEKTIPVQTDSNDIYEKGKTHNVTLTLDTSNQYIVASDKGTMNDFYIVVHVYATTVASVLVSAQGSFTSHDQGTNSQSIGIQVFDTAANYEAHKNDPIPAGYTENPVSNTNSGGGGDTTTTILGFLSKIIGYIILFLTKILYTVFSFLIAPLIEALLSVHTYKDSFVNVIYPGWQILRNFTNIFFIVILLVIAMATIFRVESYNYKQLLVKLIIAALFVNFSLIIGQAVLGLAETVQNQFLPNNAAVIRTLAKSLMVDPVSTFTDIPSGGTNAAFGELVKPFVLLALAFMAFFTFVIIAVFLVIRMVALWILLMLSPIAYVASILPETKKYYSQWWDMFLKYAFLVPVLAFFLNIAALFANDKTFLKGLDTGQNGFFGGTANAAAGIASNIMVMVFMLAGLKIAQSSGTFGAEALVNFAKKATGAPFAFAGKRGGGYLLRQYNERTNRLLEQHEGKAPPGIVKKSLFAVLQPKAFVKGWQARSEELTHMIGSETEAGGKEVAEQLLTGGKLKIPHRQFVERQEENDYLKEYGNMKKESLMAAAASVETLGGAEGNVRRRAIVKAAAKNGYLDDLLRMKKFAEKYGDGDGTVYSAEVLNRFLFGYLGHDEQAMRFMAEDMEELGKDTGHYEYLGQAYYDPDSKSFKRGMDVVGKADGIGGREVDMLKNTWQKDYAAGELAKVGGRQRAQIAPHNLVPLRAKLDDKGNFVDSGTEISTLEFGKEDGSLDEYSQAILRLMDPATLRDIHFAQARTKEWVLSKNIDQNSGEVIVDSEEDVKRIQNLWDQNPDFVKAMYAQSANIEARLVKGFKVSILKGSGKTSVEIGDSKLTPSPISPVVADEIIKEGGSRSLQGLDEKNLKELNGMISKYAAKVYEGELSKPELESSLRTELASAVNTELKDPTRVTAISAELPEKIFEKVSAQIKEKYNATPVIKKIDVRLQHEKGGLKGPARDDAPAVTASITSEINKAVTEAAQRAFDKAKDAGDRINESYVRAEVEEAIKDLRSTADDRKSKVYEAINDDEINMFVSQILPSKDVRPATP